MTLLCQARKNRRLSLGTNDGVFMDESSYILDCIDGRQKVWQSRGKNIHDDCIQETTQGGGGSVMVWADIHYGGKTPLLVL